jgi:hypothetical protein
MTELPDRLLRDALRPGAPATPSNVCVDAEALAAWADGTMNGADRSAFEIHAVGCARCQALMAAMARTEPPPAEPAWWRRAVFSWVMPLAAATAAIVIGVSLTSPERRAPATQVARQESTAATPSRDENMAASRAAAPPAPAPAASQAPASAKPDSRRERDAIPPAVRRQDQPKDAAGLPAAKTEPRATDANANAAPVLAQSPPPSPPPAPPSAASTVAGAREVAAPSPAPPAGSAVSADAAASTRNRDALRMKAVALPPLVIASPARDSQWRIVGGAVEHTDDGGVTWRSQALGVDVPVRAGAAPAARVCWLVGARGLVLLTTDGARWRRIDFPESADLVAIEATDASHATVTTADGRRFGTGDGGLTWIGR